MKFIDEKTILVEGDIYTNMLMNPELLSNNGIIIHARGDAFFGLTKYPKGMRPNDFYLNYEEFIKTYGPIYDIIVSSKI